MSRVSPESEVNLPAPVPELLESVDFSMVAAVRACIHGAIHELNLLEGRVDSPHEVTPFELRSALRTLWATSYGIGELINGLPSNGLLREGKADGVDMFEGLVGAYGD